MPRRHVFWTLAALAVLAAVWQAWALRWTCDDAFISFRYAKHFVDGHGLVFNLDPAEAPVEGYTNFSWTMWLALGLMFGLGDQGLETWSVVWGIACHAGTVLLLAAIAWRASGGRALVPVAACAYAAIHHAASLAPAGLETALFVLLGLVMLRYAIALRCAREAWLCGFVGVVAAMTRPDGALFVAAGGGFVLFDTIVRRAPRLLLGYGAPFLLAFVPYLLWRHAFYGHWVPNTAVAKSASEPFVAQGWLYVRDFFVCYWPLLSTLPVLGWFALKKGDLLAPISPFLGRRPWWAIAAFVLPYVAFVIWVGGDFMFSRFLLPVLPMLLLGWDLALQRWRPLWLQPVVMLALVVGLQLRLEPAGLDDPTNAVSDNRRISMHEFAPGVTMADAFRIVAHDYLRPLFAGLDVRIAIAGGHANVAYWTDVPVAIEVAAGLTDAHIARLPYVARGKAGHGKPSDPEYLESRGVQLHFEDSYRKEQPDREPWRNIRFVPVDLHLRLVTWDRELMAELRRRDKDIDVQDFEQVLDDYLAAAAAKSKQQLADDFARFRRFYFDHNDDPARRARFEALLR
ncbi:MAG: hypothetical protein H6835_02325 [Planctomycetes bacterium]|nr:hypothetical protein [Planctomycetota bacterium]